MLGGNGTPDNYNAQRASSLYVRKSSKKSVDARCGLWAKMRPGNDVSVILLELQRK